MINTKKDIVYDDDNEEFDEYDELNGEIEDL